MKKEIDLLEKVYSLYIDVITTVGDYKELLWSEYKDLMWADVHAPGQTPPLPPQMMARRWTSSRANSCKRMPKALREYEAFVELKRSIDDFLETLPFVQALAHPCMRSRHWRGS